MSKRDLSKLTDIYRLYKANKKPAKATKIEKTVVYNTTSISSLYNEYQSRYTQKEKLIKEKYGVDMYAGMSPNEMNFEMLYEGMRQKHSKDTPSKIIDRIVNQQASKLTWSSASRLATGPANIMKAMYDPSFIMNDIHEAYTKMREEGICSSESKRLISYFYFGSEI